MSADRAGHYAIVGIGCRFPGGADSPDAFWNLLIEGRDAIGAIPDDRPDWHRLYDADPAAAGRIYMREGGFIEGIDRFDARFFGISPREAAHIDPQHRLLLEVVWNAFEDASIPASRLAGSDTGVFVGISTHDYADVQMYPENREAIDAHSNTGGATSIAANRVSYAYDFRGPSLAVDTACSSALSAVHLACKALDDGDCSIAVACGVQLLLRPELTVGFCRATMLSVDNRCKAFDAAANGYVRSEGAGAIVLKPLDRARADGDAIYAVVLGTAINQDGRSAGLTVPSERAQRAMLETSLRRAGIAPADVGYVEAHGTGTPIGDPIEARAIGGVLGKDRVEPLRIGSVKTNIGHLEAASGIAGLIKTALALRHRKLPPSLHFRSWNPGIDAEALGLRVVTEPMDWPVHGARAVAAVNSFGFGGANASVVLSEAPLPPQRTVAPDRAELLTLSARSDTALRALAQRTAELLRSPDVAAVRICGTAALGRAALAHRVAVVADDAHGLANALDAFVAGERIASIATGTVASDAPRRAVFVFSGMGPQWWAMGRELLEAEPAFRAMMERCAAALRPVSGWSLIDAFRTSETESRLADPEIAQVSNFALQVALAAQFEAWGIRPAAVIGHSGGAMAAAYVAGVHSLDDAIALAYHRSRLQGRPSNGGGMLAVGLSEEAALRSIDDFAGRVVVAAINAPSSVTLAGDPDALDVLAGRLADQQVFARRLAVTIAYHSHAMDPIREEFLDAMHALRGAPPSLPLISDTTGGWAEDLAFDADYWWRAIRSPVRFADGVAALIDAGHRHFLEIAPHPVLAASIGECLAAKGVKGRVVPSLRRGDRERAALLRAAAALHVDGLEIDWSALYERDATLRLPLYPWQRERHWFEPAASAQRAAPAADDPHPLLHHRVAAAQPLWETRLSQASLVWLDDHVIQSAPVFPGAGYVEMALVAARRLHPEGALVLRDVEFLRPLVLAGRDEIAMQIAVDSESSRFEIHSRRLDGTEEWTRHAKGRLGVLDAPAPVPLGFDALQPLREDARTTEGFYTSLYARGLRYGASFRGLTKVHAASAEAIGEIGPVETLVTDAFLAHPALLDAAFQLLAACGAGSDARLFLPVRIAEIRFHAGLGDRCVARCALDAVSGTGVTGHVELCDADGVPCLSVRGLQAQFVDEGVEGDALDTLLYVYRWEQAPLSVEAFGMVRRSVLPSLAESRACSHDIVAAIERDTAWPRYYAAVEPYLTRLAANGVVAALERLGALHDGRLTQSALAALRARDPSGGLWTERLVGLLADAGCISTTDDGWDVKRAAADAPPEAAAYGIDIALLSEASEGLADAWQGSRRGKDAIFTADALPLLARFYDDAPASAFYNRLLAEAVAGLAAKSRRSGVLRVLEIGAGTGGTTRHLLDALSGQPFSYVCTDSAPMLVDSLRERFGSHRGVVVQTFDLTREASEQGFPAGTFDLVVGANVVHATPDVRASLAALRSLLAPGGTLALIEITRAPRWLDVIFGQTAGWWAFTDRTLRPAHPLLPSARWRALLEEAGFADVLIPLETDVAGEPAQSVLLATTPATADAAAQWLVLGEASGPAEAIRDGLAALGRAAQLLPADAGIAAVAALPASAGVVLVLDVEHVEQTPSFAATAIALDLLKAAVQRADALRAVWIVTTGATLVDGDDGSDIAQAAVSGLCRTVLKERAELPLRIADIGRAPSAEEIDALLTEMTESSNEEELAFRGARRHVRRLRRTSRAALPSRKTEDDRRSDWRVKVGQRGSLASLHFESFEPAPLGEDEVRIDVRAASLNFRDVMLAVGGIPGLEHELSFGHQRMGSDCAGVVVACGAGVDRCRVGDRIIAMAAGSLASTTITPQALVAPLPPHLDFASAASLPTVYLTAWYALVHLARLRRGERILIHAATGGVGFAAVQIARLIGAEIFATAGSDAKRAYLRELGVAHVMDSRSLVFADEVLATTAGAGVDVVLNSLAGEAIERGIACLAPYGRFVEIGKRDIYANSTVALAPFRRNLSFFAVDLDRLCAERPALIGEMLDELAPHFASGALVAPPLHRFGFDRVEEAFRLMAQARHIGKIVLERDPQAPPPLQDDDVDTSLRKDGTYLVTGGLGGFGLEMAAWLAANGAGCLALAGRRDPDERTRRRLDALRVGCRVEVLRCDVGRADEVEHLFARIDAEMPPLRGVFHAAMVLDDGPLENMDAASLERVLAPKALGAWWLHVHTRDRALDHFVLFSSIAALLGNPMQANYGAACAFLDALAEQRHRQDLPAISINWGVLAGAGYVADRPELGAFLEQQGYAASPVAEALRALGLAMRSDIPELMASRVDWQRLRDYSLRAASSPRIADLVPAAETGMATAASDALARILEAPPADRGERTASYLAETLARILGSSPGELDAERPLDQLGLDSLLAVELTMRLAKDLGVELPVITLLGGMTIARLAGVVVERLPSVHVATASTVPIAPKIAAPADARGIESAARSGSSLGVATATAEIPEPPPQRIEQDMNDATAREWTPLQRLARAVSRASLHCVGDIAVDGLEHVPAEGPCIIAVNHLSMADVPLALSVLPRKATMLATTKLRRSPLLDWLVGGVGQAIYVEPNDASSAALEHAFAILARGGIVAMSPEGTRSRTGLLRGKTGVAWLAERAGVPVIPYVAWGQERWRERLRQWRRIPIRVRVGAPVPSPETDAGPLRLVEHTRRIMLALAELLPAEYRGVYASGETHEPEAETT
jgi:1-acyl-sn-glycerol-3-phosphate acyltransferase